VNGRTKIVATLGPATDRPEVLDEVILAGVDVVRLNLSHGSVDSHIARLRAVRESAARTGSVVAVLADLPGRRFAPRRSPTEGLELHAGATVSLHPDAIVSSDDVVGRRLSDVVGGPPSR
jgi:pyruvate kinase